LPVIADAGPALNPSMAAIAANIASALRI